MSTYALTGEFASGKTTVSRLLKSKGAIVFNADKRIHQYYNNKKSKVYTRVARAFPPAVRSGKISRKILAKIVLAEKRSLRLLESIVHPAVIEELTQWLKKSSAPRNRKSVYIAEIPLLFEKKLDALFDRVILVRTDRQVLLSRIQKKYKCTATQASSRLALFMPIEKKTKKSDYVINNSSTRAHLRKETVFLWETLVKGHKHAAGRGCFCRIYR